MMTVLRSLLLVSTLTPVTFPGVQPQLAAARQRVGLVFGQGGKIHFALSRDAGRSFSTPVAVPSRGRLALGRHRGPRIALTDDAIVITAILGDGPQDGDLFAWRSVDDGRSWSDPRQLNQVPASAREGLHATATFGSALKLGQGTWPLEACPMDGGALAFGADDRLTTVWRRGDDVLLAQPGGTEQRLGTGRDPALAVSGDGTRYAVWRSDEGLVIVDSRKSETRPLSAGAQAPVLIALADGRVLAAWERAGQVEVSAVSGAA